MFGDSGLPVILTSATITSGKNEDYIKNYTYFINNTGFQIERSLVCEPKISPLIMMSMRRFIIQNICRILHVKETSL